MAFETIDNRQWRMQVAQRKVEVTIVTGKTGSTDVAVNGELLNYVIVAPDLATDADFTLSFVNEDSETTYSKSSISDNTTTAVLVSATPVPMSGTITVTCSCTTDQTDKSFTIYLYYK